MKHLRDELHRRRFVRVLFGEFKRQLESAVLERCVGWAEDDRVPQQNVILRWHAANARWWVILESANVHYIKLV